MINYVHVATKGRVTQMQRSGGKKARWDVKIAALLPTPESTPVGESPHPGSVD